MMPVYRSRDGVLIENLLTEHSNFRYEILNAFVINACLTKGEKHHG